MGRFYRLFFGEVSPETFSKSVSENSAKFHLFLILRPIRSSVIWCDPSDISRTEVGINLNVNRLCLRDLAHFFMTKAIQAKTVVT